jgi:hypothetical protein
MIFYVPLDTQESILLKSQDKSFHALYYILHQVNNEENLWYSDRVNKDFICDKLNISSPTLEKIIYSLKKRDIIIPVSRGKYKLSKTLTQDYEGWY